MLFFYTYYHLSFDFFCKAKDNMHNFNAYKFNSTFNLSSFVTFRFILFKMSNISSQSYTLWVLGFFFCFGSLFLYAFILYGFIFLHGVRRNINLFYPGGPFTKEDMQRANIHEKLHFTHREMKMKAIKRHFAYIRLAKLKRLKMLHADKGVEKAGALVQWRWKCEVATHSLESNPAESSES